MALEEASLPSPITEPLVPDTPPAEPEPIPAPAEVAASTPGLETPAPTSGVPVLKAEVLEAEAASSTTEATRLAVDEEPPSLGAPTRRRAKAAPASPRKDPSSATRRESTPRSSKPRPAAAREPARKRKTSSPSTAAPRRTRALPSSLPPPVSSAPASTDPLPSWAVRRAGEPIAPTVSHQVRPDGTRSWLDFQASWAINDSWSQQAAEQTATATPTAPAAPPATEDAPCEQEGENGGSVPPVDAKSAKPR
jgi:hypothetical protein